MLAAGAQVMTGYLIQEELRSLPPEQQVATVLTMIMVDPQDPAFSHPSKSAGLVYARNSPLEGEESPER